MSFVITGYPVVIVENKDPGDSHALEHHAPPCSYAGTGKSWNWSVSRPTELAGAGFEEGLEGGTHGDFVGDGEAGEPLQCRVAVLDLLVRRFEGGVGILIEFAKSMAELTSLFHRIRWHAGYALGEFGG